MLWPIQGKLQCTTHGAAACHACAHAKVLGPLSGSADLLRAASHAACAAQRCKETFIPDLCHCNLQLTFRSRSNSFCNAKRIIICDAVCYCHHSNDCRSVAMPDRTAGRQQILDLSFWQWDTGSKASTIPNSARRAWLAVSHLKSWHIWNRQHQAFQVTSRHAARLQLACIEGWP